MVRALAQQHPEAVFNTVLDWCEGAERLSDQHAANRLGVGCGTYPPTCLPTRRPPSPRRKVGLRPWIA